MFGLSSRTRVWVHKAPVDMRKHYDGLWGLVTNAMGKDVFSGDAFAFIGRTRKRAKVLWWDGTGLYVLSKRLERGKFAAPWERRGETFELTGAELNLLLEGCEVVGRVPLSAPSWSPKHAVA